MKEGKIRNIKKLSSHISHIVIKHQFRVSKELQITSLTQLLQLMQLGNFSVTDNQMRALYLHIASLHE